MIDTDKYEGCQTDRPLFLHKGYLCPTIFMDVDGSGEIVPTLDRRLVDVQADIPEHYLQLLQDAPLLLAEVKQLRKTNEFHMMLDAEETKEQLKLQKENDNLTKLCIERYAEVKRLREELEESYQKRDKNSGALNIALEHLGYQGADHEQFCKEQYECNVYGDDLESEEE